MPEEAEIGEVGIDKVGEEAAEKASGHGQRHGAGWMRLLALSTALFAVIAAIASLKSGHYANEALLSGNAATLKQAEASDQWSYYQSKGIKSVVRLSVADVLAALHAPADETTKARSDGEKYRGEQEEIQKEARALEAERAKLEEEARTCLRFHQRFAYVVTMLQVAIGLSAVAALIMRRSIWLLAVLVGTAGTAWFVASLLSA
jgi:hypothetical protein